LLALDLFPTPAFMKGCAFAPSHSFLPPYLSSNFVGMETIPVLFFLHRVSPLLRSPWPRFRTHFPPPPPMARVPTVPPAGFPHRESFFSILGVLFFFLPHPIVDLFIIFFPGLCSFAFFSPYIVVTCVRAAFGDFSTFFFCGPFPFCCHPPPFFLGPPFFELGHCHPEQTTAFFLDPSFLVRVVPSLLIQKVRR